MYDGHVRRDSGRLNSFAFSRNTRGVIESPRRPKGKLSITFIIHNTLLHISFIVIATRPPPEMHEGRGLVSRNASGVVDSHQSVETGGRTNCLVKKISRACQGMTWGNSSPSRQNYYLCALETMRCVWSRRTENVDRK
jgi:hypothetical protein